MPADNQLLLATSYDQIRQELCLSSDLQGTFSRCPASKAGPRIRSQLRYDRSFFITKYKLSGLRGFNAGFQFQIRRNMKNVAIHAGVPPGAPFPAGGDWKVWILGTIVTVLLSFSKGKWGPLLKLKEKVETTLEEMEKISDVVEEVAEKVEEVAEAAAEHLPEGKLQDVAELIENLAEQIDKDAHLAGDVLDKVEEMVKEVDSFVDADAQEKTVVSEEAEDQK
ncbi:uncharacterized protein LOC129301953 isoform X2 [Prosopis cineraria]|uniref:uncharacterized protein LOC129301953 isoform X2 n=1 Tax=Prosopis cineraria TaxID=364024 RepID=UPI0024101233|nr:uncharacterized protein LOC129301953 isoform X2 [Prosopis cineraria]